MFLKTKSVVGKITNSLTPKQQTVVKEKQTVMAVQFYLFPRALKSGERPISMSAHIANTRIQTTIGISVNPDYWFDAKQKVKKGAVNSKGLSGFLFLRKGPGKLVAEGFCHLFHIRQLAVVVDES